jgi:hypothetical protein
MPGIQAYEVLLDFTNDTLECATVQLLRDYGRNTGAIVFLHPGENVTLVLDAGSVYRYALKMHSKVADVTCVICSCCIGGHTHEFLPLKQSSDMERHPLRLIASVRQQSSWLACSTFGSLTSIERNYC